MAALIVADLLLAYRLYQRRGRDAPAGADGEASVDPRDDHVECPDCGVENEVGYRFCRSCLSELPGTMAFMRDRPDPLGGLTR